MLVFGVSALRYLFESGDCFYLEEFELLQDLSVSYFVEFLFFAGHSGFEEIFVGFLGGELEEEHGGEGIQKEVLQIAFAVFVAHVPDKIKICVVFCPFYLLQGFHHEVVALVVAVREQKEHQHVRHSLPYHWGPRIEHVCAHQVAQKFLDF